ncbi:MAG: hypothetical protein KDB90_15855 [Planctomycetes bacterium]|nr:hypothetical protein [Planctomycetota bacterium]
MQKVTPHWGWFLLAPAVLVLGGIAAVALMAVGLTSVADGMERIDVPGERVVHVAAPGNQTIFYEQTGGISANPPADLVLEITPASGGEPLALSEPVGDVNYNMNGVAGRNFKRVNFPAAGDYKVSATLPLGATGGRIAFGGNPAEKIVGSLLGFFGIGGVSFLLCVIILVVVAVKRSGSRKRMLQQQYGRPPQGGMPPAPPPGQTI